ncbi:MAG: ubiquinone/menaquinone biosynthesis C-methylase UbiE [Planctomycetota bacterium]|jgi:ubiquinone/menaquinone biosynthesis C-methylase UbiE
MELPDSTRLLKALGDENRLRILNLLSHEELHGSDLMEILNMGQSRVSTHLNLLKEVELVVDRRAGRRSYYSTKPGAPLVAEALICCQSTPEFQADVAGLQALKERRKQETRSYFDRVSKGFGEENLPGRTWEGLCRSLIKLLPRGRYADLGIGDGLLTMMLAEIAEEVTAVDLSAGMLAQLKQRAAQKGLTNIVTVEGDIDDLPLSNNSYDYAVLSQALHHSQHPESALHEAVRILKPGGKLLVIDLLAHNEEWVREKLQDRQQGFTDTKLKELLINSGLEMVNVQRVARDPQPPHFMTLVATGQLAEDKTIQR